jgi:2Fe-2S ferredoxin
MPKLIVVGRGGDAQVIESESGRSIMELIRNAGVGEMLAICGGCLCCATCHIYVDPVFSHKLPAMSEEEKELLSQSDHRTQYSRLACQIPFRAELDGLKVQIAAEG